MIVGLSAAEELVAKVFGLPVAKARKVNPNAPKGFDALVIGLLRDLTEAASPFEREAIKSLVENFDRDWPSMTRAAQKAAVDRAAREYLDMTRAIPVATWPTYAVRGKSIVEQTKATTALNYGLRIVPSFDLADEAAIKASANMQALYTRDNYGKRSESMSAQARQIVSAGIGEGLDRYEIGKNLSALYTGNGVVSFKRSESYFRMIASVFTARARSYSNLSAYNEAGVEKFQFEAVLDEVTTDVCRMMHGRTFSTREALGGYVKVAASEDPEDVTTIQPWVQSGKNDDGDQILYYKRADGARVKIANVDQSGVGKKDTVGTYSGVSPKQLAKAGISSPPLHAHCRSTIVPAGTTSGFVPMPAIATGGRAPAETTTAPAPAPVEAVPRANVDAIMAAKVMPRQPIKFRALDDLGLPTFAHEDGRTMTPENYSKTKEHALIKLFDEGVRKSGGFELDASWFGFEGGVGQSREAYESIARVMELEGVKSFGDLVKRYGETTEVDLANVKKIVLPKAKLDARKVGEAIGGNRPIGPADFNKQFPLVLFHKGKYYAHDGAEVIASEIMIGPDDPTSGGIFGVRVINVDKFDELLAPTVSRVDFMRNIADPLRRIEDGTATPKDQFVVRENVRSLLAQHGILTRDDQTDRMKHKWGERSNAKEKIEPEPMSFQGLHDWRGQIKLAPGVAKEAALAADRFVANPEIFKKSDPTLGRLSANLELSGLRTIVHEELHGASALLSAAYKGSGVGIEEAGTEILARKIMRELIGFSHTQRTGDVPMGLPVVGDDGRVTGGWGSYQTYIRTVIDVVEGARRMDPKWRENPVSSQEMVENAYLETRKWDPNKRYYSGKDQINDFVGALGFTDKETGRYLRKALATRREMKP